MNNGKIRVELSKERIDEVFKHAIAQSDYTLDLYKLVVPEWDKVKQMGGFPRTNKKTGTYIMGKAIRFDAAHHPGVLHGGMWMNNGFGTEEDLPDWTVEVNVGEIEYE